MKARQKKIKRKKSSAKLLRWLFFALVLSVCARYLWVVLLKLEKLGLKVENIVVEGNNMVSAEKVISVLELEPGLNILRIKVKELEEKLEKLPRIDKVVIKRNFPDSLKIDVIEVRPVGFLMKGNKRYVVTIDGMTFPGTEGPEIEFKIAEQEKIITTAKLLIRLKDIAESYYKKIIAIDCNYRDEIIIYGVDYYVKWPSISAINDFVIKRNVYMLEKIENEYTKKGVKITYMDLRFVSVENNKIKGAIIVK